MRLPIKLKQPEPHSTLALQLLPSPCFELIPDFFLKKCRAVGPIGSLIFPGSKHLARLFGG